METVCFNLTHDQIEEINKLGKILWPDQKLSLGELSRRICLSGAEILIGVERGDLDPPQLQAPADKPTGGTAEEEVIYDEAGNVVRVEDGEAE